jgi:hypothetical protein
MNADLGSIAKQFDKRGIAGFGDEFWTKHKETISGFWDSIEKYFSSLEVNNFKIYQDSLIADGEIAQRIVEDAVKASSKNYEIIADLIKKGATLVQTEDFALVKKEMNKIVKISNAKTIVTKIAAFLLYKLSKNKLLIKRDKYISKRIDETLKQNETGILFLGASHDIISILPDNIQLVEVKEAKKVSDYQRLLLSVRKDKNEFEELGKYLVAQADECVWPD